MGYLQDLLAEKATILRGITLMLGGAALILAGTLIGLDTARGMQIAAGSLAVTGVIVMFLGFFVYLLPPLLPAR